MNMVLHKNIIQRQNEYDQYDEYDEYEMINMMISIQFFKFY